ncbi:MAG: cytochrome c3 family protein [Dissulfurimicrobium sp.]|uniref:cytochrome c3 family protein n=1 Tax=Dissulfurimicrobium sp. TaxID=2022436 RepID=UPI003D0A5B0C
MAAKSERGGLKSPFTSEGKRYFFDVGTADEMGVCYSCHPGGGPAEGIVQANGTVIPYTDPTLKPVHTYDRDFYDYSPHATTEALNSQASISDTIAAIGAPKAHDWHQSGVMEADCLLCHIDPQSPYALKAADGLKAQPFRPRLMIFASRQNGQVQSISLGMPLNYGLFNESAFSYTNDPQRMSRPTKMLALDMLPPDVVGQMMKMWTDGLKQIEKSGISLPYALYGPNVNKIWTSTGIKGAYCPNPAGPADEAARLANAAGAINQLFSQLLGFMQSKGLISSSATMNDMMALFFNDFIYGYKIKDQMGNLLPIPVPLRAYEPGKFYTDWDDCNASVRDYVRAPLIEGEGIPYSGKVGMGWGAAMYAVQRAMQGDSRYITPAGTPDVAAVMADVQKGVISQSAIQPALHEYLPNFFYMMPTAGLMGFDLNQDGVPLTYVRIDKSGGSWQAKAYWNTADLGDGYLRIDMFGGPKDIGSYKWVNICGQCHVMTKDHGNSEWNYARTYNLGMPADWVKNGQYVNFTNDIEASGYDVHMSSKKMGCGSCHLRAVGTVEDKHNFLKGTDTAHMVSNELDNNPKPKTCEYCHLSGGDPQAPNPTAAHEEKFGENTGRHMAEIACETCHVPYRRTWRFRTFDDTMGYFSNFDNRMGYNILPGGDGKMAAYPPEYALSPVYGTSPGYGIPHFNMLSQHIDANGGGVVPMDYVSQMVDYFNMSGSADPGQIVNGMPTNPGFDFWRYFYEASLNQYKAMGVPLNYDPAHDNEVFPPLYYANSRNGYPQIVIGNPITIMTWVDANPQPDHDMSDLPYGGAKVLYLREINAAIQAYIPPLQVGAVDPRTLAGIPPNDPNWARNPNVGKIILKDSGYVIFDHTGDMYPDLWWDEDVRAMQQALVKVLKAEGETDPKPIIFVAAHYFSDSHGVQTKEKALGARSCFDCHGDYTKDPGAHRITDRIITYVPWAPPWFRDDNRVMKYDPAKGMVPANPNGLFIVDGEVAYIQPQQADNLSVLGAKAQDVLALSKHHAEELFYITSEGSVRGYDITEINDPSKFTPDELAAEYAKQVVNGPWSDKLYFYIPEDLKPELSECGFQPQAESVYLDGIGLADAYVLRLGLNTAEKKAMIVKLPFTGAQPEIWTKVAGDTVFRKDASAAIVGYSSAYVVAKVNHPGEFVCVEHGLVSGTNSDLWKPFIKK